MDRKTARKIIQTPPLDPEYVARRLVDGSFDWTGLYQSREHAAIDRLAEIGKYTQVYYRRGEFAYLTIPALEPINNTLLGFGTPPPEFGVFDPRDEVEEALLDAGGNDALVFFKDESITTMSGDGGGGVLYVVYWPTESIRQRSETMLDALEIPSLKLLWGLWYADFVGEANELIDVDRSFVPIRRAGAAHPLEQRNLTTLARSYVLYLGVIRRMRQTEVAGFAYASNEQEAATMCNRIKTLAERHSLRDPMPFIGPRALSGSEEEGRESPLRAVMELVRWRRVGHVILPDKYDLPKAVSVRAEIASLLAEACVALVTTEGLISPDEVRAYLLGESETMISTA